MAKARKKTATKTAKKCCASARKKCSDKNCKCVSNHDRMHVYIITAMSMIAGILLCANAAMMIV